VKASVKTFQEVWVWEVDGSSDEWVMNQRESSKAAAEQINEWVQETGVFMLGIDIGSSFQGDEVKRQLHTTYAVRFMSVEDYIRLESTIRKHATAGALAEGIKRATAECTGPCRLGDPKDPLRPR